MSADLTRDEAAALVIRIPTDILGKGDMDAIDQILEPDFVDHNPPMPGAPEGIEGVRQTVQMLRAAISNLTPDKLVSIVEGTTVALRWEGAGRHDGMFMGLPATGKEIQMSGIMIAGIGATGRISERWSQINMMEVMQQLGVIPAMSGVFRALEPTLEGGASSPEENKALVARYVEELWNAGNLDAADELFHPGSVIPHVPLPMGPAGAKAMVGMFRGAFPDVHAAVEDVVAEGDLVAARLRKTGTNDGPFFGMPPTGLPVDFEELLVMRVVDGKIIASWFEADQMAMMQQLGLGGPPPPDPA